MDSDGDSVVGVYDQRGRGWVPALSECSQLFTAITLDDIATVKEAQELTPAQFNTLVAVIYRSCPDGTPESLDSSCAAAARRSPVTIRRRTLVMIAAYHGSIKVLSYMLSKGAAPSLRSSEGFTATDFANQASPENASTVIEMLQAAEKRSPVTAADPVVPAPIHAPRMLASDTLDVGHMVNVKQLDIFSDKQLVHDQDGHPYGHDSQTGPYSTDELTKPEYSTDQFRMYNFKILPCSKRYAHDWRACPFAHPTENARRRSLQHYRYCATACPDYKQGFCVRGDGCPYAHGVFETWLHPSRYRTQLCKDRGYCNRPVCFFAHDERDLRFPSHNWTPTIEDLMNPATVMAPSTFQTTGLQVTAAQSMLSSMGSLSLSDSQDMTPTSSDAAGAGSACSQLFNSVLPVPDTLRRLNISNAGSGGSLPGTPQGQDMSPMGGNGYNRFGSMSLPDSPVQAVMAPRMSNAFARKHGLDPKDNAVLNMQKLAAAGQLKSTIIPPESLASVHNLGRAQQSALLPPQHLLQQQLLQIRAQQQQQQHAQQQQQQQQQLLQAQVNDAAALAMLNHQIKASLNDFVDQGSHMAVASYATGPTMHPL